MDLNLMASLGVPGSNRGFCVDLTPAWLRRGSGAVPPRFQHGSTAVPVRFRRGPGAALVIQGPFLVLLDGVLLDGDEALDESLIERTALARLRCGSGAVPVRFRRGSSAVPAWLW